jgi:PilZ domain
MQVGSIPPSDQKTTEASAICVHEIRVSVCLEDGTPVAAELVELARMDLMLRVDRPLRFSTPIRLVLFRDFAGGVAHCRAVVHWCRTEQGCWKLGAFLTTRIADCITERCGADLRAHLRYPAGWNSWVRFDANGQLERAMIYDYSIGGVSVLLPCRAEPGEQLSLFGSGSPHSSQEVHARVQWCHPHEKQFLVGCFLPSQSGKDLPRIFENLGAIHAEAHNSEAVHAANDPGHVSWIEQALLENFRAVESPAPVAQDEDRQQIRLEADPSGAWTIR